MRTYIIIASPDFRAHLELATADLSDQRSTSTPPPLSPAISPIMMDQRELESSIKQLQKTVNANEPPANAVSILERLKKEASPTEEMLRVSVDMDYQSPHTRALAWPRLSGQIRLTDLFSSIPSSRPGQASTSAS